jgi:hypothetical protein
MDLSGIIPNSLGWLLECAWVILFHKNLVKFGGMIAFQMRLKTWTAAIQPARFLGSSTAVGTRNIPRGKGFRHVLTLLFEVVSTRILEIDSRSFYPIADIQQTS